MAGRIKADDVALVKERSSIEDVVREHVTLRSAGPGSMKGLCPFHDEKSPSFNVRPAVGAWHCFGCGEGGDVISFLQKIDHLTFAEAVERLAGKLGMELHYEEGGRPARGGPGPALAARRGPPGGRRVLRRRAGQPAGGPGRPRLPARARLRPCGGRPASASASPRGPARR